MNAPTPNLPALLVQLAEEGAARPQREFALSAKAAFLEALAGCGSVRDAARRVGVSHMTAYRARRACPAFRRCWDAALVCALPQAEEELACRAIDGVEEEVLYHGEVVATRRRKDPRLLLAHLARLDRLAARADVAALADRFDDALAALERGEDLPECASAEGQGTGSGSGHASAASGAGVRAAGPSGHAQDRASGNSSPGPCNMRNISNTPGAAQEAPPAPFDPETTGDPLCDAMEEARPWGAKLPADYPDPDLVEALQMAAFDGGVEQWWCVTNDAELEAALDALEEGEGGWRVE